MNKIGIFGGSFNPVHNTHINIALTFVNQLNLSKCLLIPTNISPFKLESKDSNFFTVEQRLDMLNLAIKNIPKLEIDDYEIKRQEISYTYKTIKYLEQKYPNDVLYLLIGTDQAINLKKWRKWDYILEKVQLCIVERANVQSDLNNLNNELKYREKIPIIINFPKNSISSTLIRQLIKEKKDLNDLVPYRVKEYIYKLFNY